MSDSRPISKQEIEAVWDWLDSYLLFHSKEPTRQQLTTQLHQALQNMKKGRWYSSENQSLLNSVLQSLRQLPASNAEDAMTAGDGKRKLPADLMQHPEILISWAQHYVDELNRLFKTPSSDDSVPS